MNTEFEATDAVLTEEVEELDAWSLDETDGAELEGGTVQRDRNDDWALPAR